ncbi:MAG: KEOPS complex subunit Pcc1 [Candidatus Nezhaarchaeota archaeon]|nr:KEOPS complex subunit Pcc1 [Candidatus Nezhaarchaeota archaeon]MCX8141940.1 KEOPS complex subunit Pcc1 [Candidatus Nezhaarchaeota archaeon]MDW8050279.1 KEOPS complex subunit Pcc1 [Nitrososphaerota archaeon]
MKSELHISLELRIYASNLAEALLESIKPDNIVAPQQIKIGVELDKDTKEYLTVKMECDDIGTAINTLNDLLSCLQPTLKLLNEVVAR